MKTQIRRASTLVKDLASYSVTTYARPNLLLTKGKGSSLWDEDGKEYIDFAAGIAVTALGHAHDGVSEIIAEQSKQLIHVSNLYHNEWALKLSQQLVERTLASGAFPSASRAFIANSGTEANEAALKFARKVGTSQNANKIELVSFNRGFHGRTMGALSVTANEKYQKPFKPLIPGVQHGDINDIEALESLVTDKTCGVILEPIQGEGGVHECTPEFLQALRKRCDQVGAVLIFDEIQCGLGRTGDLWAHAKAGVSPDILTMAKALGNGFPISATLLNDKVESVLKVGDHGTTYGGNPLGCRVADYVLSQVSSPELLAGVEHKHKIFTNKFGELAKKYPDLVSGFRGRGLLLGLQLTRDPTPIAQKAMQNGLIVITCGVNTLRFVPALNIPDEKIHQGLNVLDDALNI